MSESIIALIVVSVMYAVTLALLTFLLRDEQKARAAASEKWAAILNEISAVHSEQLREVADRYMRAFSPNATAGEAPNATVLPREPDAEDRAAREITQATIANGMGALREMYRQNGITRTDDQLRDEVQAIADGRQYSFI